MEVLKAMRRRGLRVSLAALGAVAAACESGRNWEQAFDLLGGALSDGLALDLSLCSSVMNVCEEGPWSRALGLFAQLNKHRLRPDLGAFGSALSACKDGLSWDNALQLMGQMSHGRVRHDVAALSSGIAACEALASEGSWQHALLLPGLLGAGNAVPGAEVSWEFGEVDMEPRADAKRAPAANSPTAPQPSEASRSDGVSRRRDLAKTKMCPDMKLSGMCSRGKDCQYAHERTEIRRSAKKKLSQPDTCQKYDWTEPLLQAPRTSTTCSNSTEDETTEGSLEAEWTRLLTCADSVRTGSVRGGSERAGSDAEDFAPTSDLLIPQVKNGFLHFES
ncbi:unnamed protein product, partial [Effrenium voratum]